MQATIQPLRRQSQRDALILFWQPPVPKEQLALLWHLTDIPPSRVIVLHTLRLTVLHASVCSQGRLQCVCISALLAAVGSLKLCK